MVLSIAQVFCRISINQYFTWCFSYYTGDDVFWGVRPEKQNAILITLYQGHRLSKCNIAVIATFITKLEVVSACHVSPLVSYFFIPFQMILEESHAPPLKGGVSLEFFSGTELSILLIYLFNIYLYYYGLIDMYFTL